MKITFLGTGPSHGVPIIGCTCDVCTSKDPKNIRYRASVYIEIQDSAILIDTPPELRLQAINYGLSHVDCVLFTHQHADHIHGFDDLRRFNDIQKKEIFCFGDEETLTDIRQMYGYVFDGGHAYASKPKVILKPVTTRFQFQGIHIQPIPIYHGEHMILGYRIGDFAYLTDCSGIPKSSYPLLKGLKVLVLSALRYKPHPNHLSVEEAQALINWLEPEKAYITHMTHRIDYHQLQSSLPEHISPAYDGLILWL